jgi:hypothetical protein
MPPRKKYNPEDMRVTVVAVRNTEMGSFKTARVFKHCADHAGTLR